MEAGEGPIRVGVWAPEERIADDTGVISTPFQ